LRRSDQILKAYKQRFNNTLTHKISSEKDKVSFLRDYLCILNEFLYETREETEVDQLNNPDPSHPSWQRLTPFLAIWDDYAESTASCTRRAIA